MKKLRIHREGRALICGTVLLLFILNVALFMSHPANWVLALSLIITAGLLVFVTYFFRNPVRILEIDDPNFIIAPADGRVVVVEPTEENEYFHEQKLQVSIFMSPFNVHANWYPIEGEILVSEHQKGRHKGAWLPKSSTENERSLVVIETPNKVQIAVRQIAGAMARDGRIGYIGSYPILGVPASINAFAEGARMVNPRAKILLSWSCLPGDPVKELFERGVRVISNRDVPLPDPRYMAGGEYGTVCFDDRGSATPLASPCWMWGTLYEKIMRSVMGGSEKKEQSEAVNYWWGMDSGVIDVKLTENVPEGVRALARLLGDRLRAGEYDIFSQELYAQDGTLLCGEERLPSIEILRMDKLAETVTGRIPTYAELLPRSRVLVKELGGHLVKLPPEGEEKP